MFDQLPTRKFILLLALLLLSQSVKAQQSWPVRGQIDLSSTFGEYRPNRFHAGVDIRTGGQVGVRIYSPVDGYIWRVKTSYMGYGKGLYVIGDDGHIYVYGHMDSYAFKIDSLLKQAQMRSKRYYQDLIFPPDSLKVSRGEFLGRTGRTGSNAPHLHFEKRTPENYPVNPLSHGFKISDKIPPTFARLGFELVDDRSLLPNGQRTMFVDVTPVSGRSNYAVDSVLSFDSPFGILVDAFDRTRPGGMKQAVNRLEVYFDDTLYYTVAFDTLDFDLQRSVNLEYDYERVVNDEKKVRRLYQREGNTYWRSRPVNSDRGIFGLDTNTAYGPHSGRLVAEDCSGNKSELSFKFNWNGPNTFNFRGSSSRELKSDYSLRYQIVSDGLLISFTTGDYSLPMPQIRFYGDDSLLASRDYLVAGGISDFIAARSNAYDHIDRIYYTAKPGDSAADYIVTTNIYLVGSEENQTISPDGRFAVDIGRPNFFEPRFIEVTVDSSSPDVYHIYPEAFVCRSDFRVSMSARPGEALTRQDGLCWLDDEKNRWIWISGIDSDAKSRDAASSGGGAFRLLRDTTPPYIEMTSIKNGLTYFDPKQPIEFILSDTLSDIEDDRSITIELDGQWMIPEYDPNLKICKTQPPEPLKNGRHELRVVAVDRAGNTSEQNLHFFVNSNKN